MKHKKNRCRIGATAVRSLFALLLLGSGAAWSQVPGKIQKVNGQVIQGTIKWKASTREYVITKASGVALNIKADEVASVQVAKPTGLDDAVKKAREGRYAAAVPTLQKVFESYTMLEHDITAARWLGEAYLKTGRAKDAAAVCKQIVDNYSASALTGELAGIYIDALIEDRQYGAARSILEVMIQSGSRGAAAVAQNKRGSIDMQEGRFREALIDGYLRTIVLFAEVKDAQPEALYHAVKCFEQLGQTGHADRMRKKLLEEFPQDSYSTRLRSGS